MKKAILYILFLQPILLFGQLKMTKDTFQLQGDSVVVTATKSERKLSNITVPVTIINNKTLQQTGSLRLTDILKEQPGLSMTSGFGAGVQLQGLSPDYTIILINGEPLVGRTAGVLDLNRVALGNIKKIEIVKGPSSSLYGSEAMAGVINIITDPSVGLPLQLSLRLGSYQTTDIGLNSTRNTKQLQYQGFYNYYTTQGFSIRPNSSSRITTPITRLNIQQQLKYNFSNKTNVSLSFRGTDEQIKNNISVSNGGVNINSNGTEHLNDYNIAGTLNHRFSANLKTSFRTYVTEYNSKQELLTLSGAPYNDLLNHLFKRAENQTDWVVNKSVNAIFGAGAVWEGVKSSRYDSENSRKNNSIQYGFTQWEWTDHSKLNLIAGIRFDKNDSYASALSPKLSFLYKINKYNRIKFSLGKGFKAPDFRQLYLDFTNAAAGRYSVFGSVQAQQVINRLKDLGQIGTLYDNFYQLKTLQPENSTGIHFSWDMEPSKNSFLSIQYFRNDIQNLIQVQQVGAYVTGAQIFSYLNIGRAFTTGGEVEWQQKINAHFSINAGYQFLKTGDKEQITKIKSGSVYTKDANGFSKILALNEYVGLPNTNKHKAQLKFNYTPSNGIFANLRLLYRSKWAVNNTNGNEVFDEGDTFASGYISANTAVGKDFKNGASLQMGCDNIFNYVDALNLPNLPGRTFYLTLKYQILNKK